ncbi:MAG: hypothetical protein K2Q09_11335 [Phycisphaerales bacterium]|nr:hypothetical protein [Phycisphaerales bacterium]
MTHLEQQFNETLARTRITALETLAAVLKEAVPTPREGISAKAESQLLNLRLRAALAILRTKPIKPAAVETAETPPSVKQAARIAQESVQQARPPTPGRALLSQTPPIAPLSAIAADASPCPTHPHPPQPVPKVAAA